MPGKYSFTIPQGTTFRRSFIWKTGNPETPVDLTGCKARMQVRENPESKKVLLDLNTENGRISIPDPMTGEILLILVPEDTESLRWYEGVFDLEIVHADSGVTRLLQGSISLDQEVTRGV